MADKPFLSRWSQRKAEVRSGAPVPAEAAAPPAAASASPPAAPATPPQPLPPVESLTPESDFTGFMRPEVEEGLKRRALKALFRDPHFNVMDGLDIYIGDYSIPDPMPESWLTQLKQMERLGAYEEKVPEEDEKEGEEQGEMRGEEGPEGVAPAVEKPLGEQGLAPEASTDTSDTPEGGVPPPAVGE